MQSNGKIESHEPVVAKSVWVAPTVESMFVPEITSMGGSILTDSGSNQMS